MGFFKDNKILYQYNQSDTVVYNLVSWISYALLEAGAYTPIKINASTSGLTQLQRVKDPRYTDGQIYEGFGPSWVWETDVVSNDSQAGSIFQVSGVYINNTFFAT